MLSNCNQSCCHSCVPHPKLTFCPSLALDKVLIVVDRGRQLAGRRRLCGTSRGRRNPLIFLVCLHDSRQFLPILVQNVNRFGKFEALWPNIFLPNCLQSCRTEPAKRCNLCSLVYSSRGFAVQVPEVFVDFLLHLLLDPLLCCSLKTCCFVLFQDFLQWNVVVDGPHHFICLPVRHFGQSMTMWFDKHSHLKRT